MYFYGYRQHQPHAFVNKLYMIISFIKREHWYNKLKAKLKPNCIKCTPNCTIKKFLWIIPLNHLATSLHDYNLSLFLYKKWIFLEYTKSKFYQNILQNAPFKKNSRGIMPPNPHSKRAALPRTACNPFLEQYSCFTSIIWI